MIKAESGFKHDAISNKEAIGLMQLMEGTAYEVAKEIGQEITKQDLINAETNIKLGTKYISNLLNKYRNIELAITAYNAGIGNVDTWIQEGILQKDGANIENIPFKETNNYVRKILRDYKIYKQLSSWKDVENMLEIVIKLIAVIIVLLGVTLVYDARIITNKIFGFGDQNEATGGLKILGAVISVIGILILFYVK